MTERIPCQCGCEASVGQDHIRIWIICRHCGLSMDAQKDGSAAISIRQHWIDIKDKAEERILFNRKTKAELYERMEREFMTIKTKESEASHEQPA